MPVNICNPLNPVDQSHACPICRSKKIGLLCRVSDYDVFACGECGADHVFPQPDAVALKAYYDRPEWFEGGEQGGYINYDEQTEWSVESLDSVLSDLDSTARLSVLDIGCGYGNHLGALASRGWKCFGVEWSNHARGVATERLGGNAHVVASVSELIPHEFDVVLMLDVIEHLVSPYALFYELFAIGAISSKTRVVITTPNAGSDAAKHDPAKWVYRHPPSHLILYSSQALRTLLQRLHFESISIQGLHPVSEGAALNDSAGLLAQASGSDFTEFMRERYVPGTWSKIAEYEHVPRYRFAQMLAAGKTVLDFGCGTGYGSAIMAQVATKVIGLDIDADALAWARETHQHPGLSYQIHEDLGAAFNAGSFDVVTCFEMIEHVNHETQKAVVQSIARLLDDDGILVISTPNPEVTRLYGENPYHLREMTEEEFLDLLRSQFTHITLLYQKVDVGISLGGINSYTDCQRVPLDAERPASTPLAFIALCSRSQLPDVRDLLMVDEGADFIGEFLSAQKSLTTARLAAYTAEALAHNAHQVVIAEQRERQRLEEACVLKDKGIFEQAEEIHRLHSVLRDKESAYASLLAAHATDSNDLQSALLHKDTGILEQAEEIRRLHSVLRDKESALASLLAAHATELNSLETALLHKDRQILEHAEENQRLHSVLRDKDRASASLLAAHATELHGFHKTLLQKEQSLVALEEGLQRNEDVLKSVKAAFLNSESELNALRRTKWFRLRDAVLNEPAVGKKAARIAYLAGSMAIPRGLRRKLAPLAARLRNRSGPVHGSGVPPLEGSQAYAVRLKTPHGEARPKVVHIIANFMTGGSSRLVVDLIEGLGKYYEQSVVTSFIPDPPAYVGLEITEYRSPASDEPFHQHFLRSQPAFIHVHYWGDCDEDWYAKVFSAAERLGIPVIENINTPIAPFVSPAVRDYVYVSDYVRQVFGRDDPAHITIYPGSDFSHFEQPEIDGSAEDCVGMVYRLERDKLNELAILPFIKIVQLRPQTRVLIVGGGALLDGFKKSVHDAGVADRFEFTGYVSYETLPDLYRKMTVFAAPVWKESFGQVSPFAMNMKVPVIGYDVGAIGEIVNDAQLLAPAGDADCLAEIAIRLLDDANMRLRVGRDQRRRAQDLFSLDAMVKRYAQVYANITAGEGVQGR